MVEGSASDSAVVWQDGGGPFVGGMGGRPYPYGAVDPEEGVGEYHRTKEVPVWRAARRKKEVGGTG